MAITCKYYTPGNFGHLECNNIYDEDEQYIKENNLMITLEELPIGEFVVYLKEETQSEEDELTELAKGRTCEETIHSVVERYKRIYIE